MIKCISKFSCKKYTGYAAISFLILTVVLINSIYFLSVIWDRRDTIGFYQVFHFFYNDFYFNHTVPQWIPSLVWGHTAALYQVFSLSAVSYLSVITGCLLRIENSYIIFLISVITEHVIYSIGFFLLSRAIFTRYATAFIISLAAAGSMVWYWHVQSNLRTIYLLPYILFFIYRFFKDSDLKFFFIACITHLVSSAGSSYFFLLNSFLVFCFFVVFLISTSMNWRCIIKQIQTNKILLIVFIATLVCIGYFYSFETLNGISVTSDHRRPDGTNSLFIFLHSGGNAHPLGALTAMLSGNAEYQWDGNFYSGILIVFFLILAAWKVRKKEFYAFSISAFLLTALSYGGIIAVLISYFPAIRYFRFVSGSSSAIHVLLLVCAGFGADYLFALKSKREIIKTLVICSVFSVFVFDAILASHAMRLGADWNRTWIKLFLIKTSVYCFFGTVAVVLSFRSWRFDIQRFILNIQWACAFGLFFDLGIYQVNTVRHKLPRLPEKDYRIFKEVTTVRKLAYQHVRPHIPLLEIQKNALCIAGGGEYYPLVYPFAQFEPGLYVSFKGYLQSLTTDVFRLLSYKGHAFYDHTARLNDRVLMECVGNRLPKLRLIPAEKARYVHTQQGAITVLAEMTNLQDTAVIESPPINEVRTSLSDAECAERIHVNAFSTGMIEVNVESGKLVWLVYADAFHDGWRAYVNGKKTGIVRANIAFKGVKLPPGSHTVVFKFARFRTLFLSHFIWYFFPIWVICLVCRSIANIIKNSNDQDRMLLKTQG